MEKIIIKNFGPIKSAEISIKRFTVLIGQISSGKSTVAKLISILGSMAFYEIPNGSDINRFIELLKDYKIDFPFKKSTKINYQKDDFYWNITQEGIETNFENSELLSEISSIFQTPNKLIEGLPKLQKKYPIVDIVIKDSGMDLDNLNLITSKTGYMQNIQIAIILADSIVTKLFENKQVLYIPAERNLFSVFKDNIFTILGDKRSELPYCLTRFGHYYEMANMVSNNGSVDIPIGEIKYRFQDKSAGESVIILKDKTKVPLSKASSGYQSLIPLMLVLDIFNENDEGVMLAIEEPELNLFPSVQKELVEYVVGNFNNEKNNVIISTHSPYILTSFDTLIQAHNAGKKNPEATKEIVPEERWIDYDDISVYYFPGDGKVGNAMNKEMKMIDSNIIDAVSNVISDEYDKLLNIIYSGDEL